MDDDAGMRNTTVDMLTRLGYTVTAVADGNEAIDVYRSALQAGAGYDVVIMDLTIPGGMGGKEAVVRIRELHPEAKAIVSSGYSDDPVMADFRSYGFAGVVSKPYRIRELADAVAGIMRTQPVATDGPDGERK